MSWKKDYHAQIRSIFNKDLGDPGMRNVWKWWDEERTRLEPTGVSEREIDDRKLFVQRISNSLWISSMKKKGVGGRTRFNWFMQMIVIRFYYNNIESLVVLGAAFLIIAIGLRSMGKIPEIVVYGALVLEFFVLLVWFCALAYTPEEESERKGSSPDQVNGASNEPTASQTGEAYNQIVQKYNQVTGDLSHVCNTLTTLIDSLRQVHQQVFKVGELTQISKNLNETAAAAEKVRSVVDDWVKWAASKPGGLKP